jgi:hypothetical protein
MVRATVTRALTLGAEPRLQQLRQVWHLAARRDPALAAYERLAAARATARLRGLLEGAVALGLAEIPDAEATAWVIWSMVDALTVRLGLLGDVMPSSERLIAATTELICRAILEGEERPTR